ncbi:hypothetical protein STEG23_036525, partial [Scotinomys teguina]
MGTKEKRGTAFGILNELCKFGAILGNTSFVGLTKVVPILLAAASLVGGGLIALQLPETREQMILHLCPHRTTESCEDNIMYQKTFLLGALESLRIPLLSLRLDSWSLAWYLAVNLCIYFHQLLDEGSMMMGYSLIELLGLTLYIKSKSHRHYSFRHCLCSISSLFL